MSKFSDDERTYIVESYENGSTISEIAKETGRMYQVIRTAVTSVWYKELKVELENKLPEPGEQINFKLDVDHLKAVRQLEFWTEEKAHNEREFDRASRSFDLNSYLKKYTTSNGNGSNGHHEVDTDTFLDIVDKELSYKEYNCNGNALELMNNNNVLLEQCGIYC